MILTELMTRFSDFRLRRLFPALKQAFRITTHLTLKERIHLYLLTKGQNSVLEIGSYIGASACCFGAALKEAKSGICICIDTWNNNAMTEGNRDTWQEFQTNTACYKDYIVPVRGFSTIVVDKVGSRVESLDLLFIDGDHSYKGVKADWDAYKKFLKSGSIVVFHDWGWAEGVKRVVQKDVMPLVSSYDKLPNMWWGTIAKQP